MDRIVRVDLRWPPKPVISASARDLICQVLLLLMYVCSRVHDTITCSLFFNAFNKWNATNKKLESSYLHRLMFNVLFVILTADRCYSCWPMLIVFWLYVQLLVKDSSQRLPLQKVLTHPWIVNNADSTGVYGSSWPNSWWTSWKSKWPIAMKISFIQWWTAVVAVPDYHGDPSALACSGL